MTKYIVKIRSGGTKNITVEAENKEEAKLKFERGDYDLDDESELEMGDWEIVDVKEVE